jgi:hypothetical protein
MKNSGTLLIEVPYLSRIRRFLSSCLDWGSFYFLLMIGFSVYVNLWWLPIPFIILFGEFIFYRFIESRIYIVKILLKDDIVVIDYFDSNKALVVEVPRNELKIKWYTDTIGSFSLAHIDIMYGENKNTQYNIGEWNKQRFKLVFSELK